MENVKAGYDKAVEAVTKAGATIERHEKQLTKKVAELAKLAGVEAAAVNLANLDSYKWVDGRSTAYYWEACAVSGKVDDIKGAKKKLAERERIAQEWATKLNKAVAKAEEAAQLPAVIIEFGQRYKARCIEWYNEATDAAREKLDEAKGLDYKERRAVKVKALKIFGSEAVEMAYWTPTARAERIEKLAERRRADLIETLVYRVKEKVGNITDAAGLHIGANGEINGLVIGDKDSANVTTIYAGGYNIQCLHFRVLVK
jgi:hypothetical protein